MACGKIQLFAPDTTRHCVADISCPLVPTLPEFMSYYYCMEFIQSI